MKKKYKLVFGAALLVVAAVYAVYTLTKPVDVLLQTVAAAPLGDSFTAQGTLEPEESRIITANVSGTVAQTPVQPGHRVSTGQALVVVDNTETAKDLQQQIDTLALQKSEMGAESSIRREQVRLQLEGAEIEYYRQYGTEIGSASAASDLAFSSYMLARSAYYDAKDANDDFVRPPGVSSVDLPVSSRELYALEQQMISSRKSYIIARNTTDDTNKAYSTALIDSYRSQLGMLGDYSARQLQVTIDYLESKLHPAPIAAPFDGVVWECYAEAGSFVTENTPVARIFKDNGMKLTAKLLSEDTTGIAAGDTVDCTLTDGSRFTANVTFVSSVAQQSMSGIGLSENRCTVELSPNDLPSQAGAGFQVDLVFSSVAAQSALSVPSSAILPFEGGSAVYLERGGKAVLTPVETGLRVGGRVELLSGAADGDTVIINPQDSGIKDGKRVRGV